MSNKDDTWYWLRPAITLGYSAKQDPDGRLRFFHEDLEIVCRNNVWIAKSDNDLDRNYDSLLEALQGECWRIEE